MSRLPYKNTESRALAWEMRENEALKHEIINLKKIVSLYEEKLEFINLVVLELRTALSRLKTVALVHVKGST